MRGPSRKPRTRREPENPPDPPAEPIAAPDQPRQGPSDGPEYVVAIGGSAGGLEAFEHFFANMPADTGMAFIVIQHLDPTHKALVSEILRRSTRMPVVEIEGGSKVRADQVYVIPPNADLSILDGRLHVHKPRTASGMHMPIDAFFTSLAADQGDKSVGIIVSGMGTDGALGLKAIKEAGGVVAVQDPSSAKYDGMPRSAVDTGQADCVASIDDLPGEVLAYVRHDVRLREQMDDHSGALQRILQLLNARTKRDFSLYKKSTLYRRVAKRASLVQAEGIAEYVHYVEQNPEELDALFRELLIGVTRFFRDPEAFAYLEESVLPGVVQAARERGSIRIWVPGCSTGEEAYSIAIIAREAMDKFDLGSDVRLQVFATDIDDRAIGVARRAVYPKSIAVDIPSDRLERFFLEVENGYQVKKSIREAVVFAVQDLTSDPPFTKMDIVSCRNLLIYFSPELQRKVMPVFHHALNPDGTLFLGTAETVGTTSDVFATVDSKWKVYRRKGSATAHGRSTGIPPGMLIGVPIEERPPKTPMAEEWDEVRMVLLDRFAPPSVIVRADGDIVYVIGRTGKYLEPAEGGANWNVLAMAREGLRLELPGALHKASSQKVEVALKGLRVRTNGGYEPVDVTISPFTDLPNLSGISMIVFEGTAPEPPEAAAAEAVPAIETSEVERELAYTKERLQTTIEEMEATQEQLKSANEEMQSANEELQSTNEELTTSKEEMQSLNEELITLNNELQTKVDDLTAVSNDMINLLNSTQVATIFLDRGMNLKRFTPAVVGTFNLRTIDIGRPITDITQNLDYDTFQEDVGRVLDTLTPHERQVGGRDGDWYIMRIMPYRTVDNMIDGVVITFSDVTPLKRLEWALRESEETFRSLVASMDDIVFTLDCRHRFTAVFGRWMDKHGLTQQTFVGRTAGEVFGQEQAGLHHDAASRACAGEPAVYEWSAKLNGRPAYVQTSLSPIRDAEGNVTAVVGVGRDVTDIRRRESLNRWLSEISTNVIASRDADEVMRLLTERTTEALGMEAGFVAVPNDGGWEVKYSRGLPTLPSGAAVSLDEADYLRIVAETTEPLAVSSAARDDRIGRRFADTHRIGAIVAIPLAAGGELLSVLSLVSVSEAVGLTDVELDFVRRLGTSVSLALSNIRLYEGEKRAKAVEQVAKQNLESQHGLLQEALLPRNLRAIPGYHTAVRFVPGQEGKQVGGDFYDVFETDEGGIGVLVGDVSGKGVESAALAVAARNTIRAFTFDCASPAEALTHANAVIARECPGFGSFITAFIAILDPATGLIRYSGCGHPPPMIRRSDGRVEMLHVKGLPIAVDEHTEYEGFESHLDPGDQLVMYTDGITEARKGTKMYDIEGLQKTLEGSRGLGPDEVIETLFRAAFDASDGHLGDDAAVVAIERMT